MSGNITDSLENLVTRPPKVIERGQQANEARDAAMAAAGMEVEQSSAIDFYLDRLQTDIKESPGRVFDVAANFAAGMPGALGDAQRLTQPEGVNYLPTTSDIAEDMGASGEGYAAMIGQLLSPLSPSDFKIAWGLGKAVLGHSLAGSITGITRGTFYQASRGFKEQQKIFDDLTPQINKGNAGFREKFGFDHDDIPPGNLESLLEHRAKWVLKTDPEKYLDDYRKSDEYLQDLKNQQSDALSKQIHFEQVMNNEPLTGLPKTEEDTRQLIEMKLQANAPPEEIAKLRKHLSDIVTEAHKAPGKAVQAGIEPTTSGKSDQRLNDFLENQLARYKQEAQGREILDDLIEAGAAPRDVSRQFWDDVYPKLNPEMQKQFQGQIRALGFQPGDVMWVDKNGKEAVAKTWEDLGRFLADDFGESAEYLEGPERGYVALMEWANRQKAPNNPRLPDDGRIKARTVSDQTPFEIKTQRQLVKGIRESLEERKAAGDAYKTVENKLGVEERRLAKMEREAGLTDNALAGGVQDRTFYRGISGTDDGRRAGEYFTDSEAIARSYIPQNVSGESGSVSGQIISTRFAPKNPLVVDMNGAVMDDAIDKKYFAQAKRDGNDAVIFENVRDAKAAGYRQSDPAFNLNAGHEATVVVPLKDSAVPKDFSVEDVVNDSPMLKPKPVDPNSKLGKAMAAMRGESDNALVGGKYKHFSPKAIERARRDIGSQNSRGFIAEITPNEFLRLAKKGEDKRKLEKLEGVEAFDSIPFLGGTLRKDGDKTLLVLNSHEGRHRAKTLIARGFGDEPMPVRIVQQEGGDVPVIRDYQGEGIDGIVSEGNAKSMDLFKDDAEFRRIMVDPQPMPKPVKIE